MSAGHGSVGHVVVEADGGSRGNPGVAGYGAAVLDGPDGAVLAERRGAVGITTNNVAEYRGLIAGLTAAAELGARTVAVRMDSKLVVEQMCGRWRVKNAALQPLWTRAKALQDRFTRVTFEWIPRARNTRADKLANEAMDGYRDGSLRAEELPDEPEPTAPDPVPAKAEPIAPEPVEAPPSLFDIAEPAPPTTATTATAATTAPAAASTGSAASWAGAAGDPLRLILLRHGQTAFSVARKYSGRGDPPLTETGLAQAKAAAVRLGAEPDIAAVLTSPLTRARQTAEAVAAATGAPLETDDDLVETDFGAWEGLSFPEAARRDPEVHRAWLADPAVRPPGGESFDDVLARVARARAGWQERFGGATLVVVSHVTPIKLLLRVGLDAGPSVLYRLHLDLAALCRVDFYPDAKTSVTLVNDTSHLR